ncbi:MAG: heparinase II/III family protein [Limibacillus sp.]
MDAETADLNSPEALEPSDIRLGREPGRWRFLPKRLLFQRLRYRLRVAFLRLPGACKPLPGCHGTALIFSHSDIWPGDLESGRALLTDGYFLAGEYLENPEPLWTTPKASRDWKEGLHAFDWLRDLRSAGGDQARRKARDLTALWLANYARGWDGLAWAPQVLGRRLANILGHFEYYAANAEPPFQAALIDSLGRQARHLAKVLPAGLTGSDLLAAIKGLSFAALSLPGGETLLPRARALLEEELERQVLLDGGQAERDPFAQVAVLRDLIDLRALFHAAGEEPPAELTLAIERMGPFLRLLRHGDGGLPLFNGGLEGPAWYLDLLLQRAGGRSRPFYAAPQAGFQRLQAGRSVLVADSGRPPPAGLDGAAHAGTLSFEMSVGRERMIVNCGSHPFSERWRSLLRGTAAHSTLCFDGRNSSQLLAEGGLGKRAGDVRCRREEQEGNVWLQLSHDGYRERYGLIHHRRLFLAAGGEDLRGEDRLEVVDPEKLTAAAGEGKLVTLRFHLHPEVGANLSQGGSLLLRLKRGGGWRFHQTGGALSLEPSIYFGGFPEVRRSEQIVVTAPLDGRDTTIKWTFKREGR